MAPTVHADRRAKRNSILAELDDIEDERTRIEQRQAEIATALRAKNEELSAKRAELEGFLATASPPQVSGKSSDTQSASVTNAKPRQEKHSTPQNIKVEDASLSPSSPIPSASDSGALVEAPKHLDSIHENFPTILYLVDKHGHGEWHDCYCGRCGANSFVNKDTSYPPVFIRGLEGFITHMRLACKKPGQVSMTDTEVLAELHRRPVSSPLVAALRNDDRIHSHSQVFFVADGEKRNPGDSAFYSSLDRVYSGGLPGRLMKRYWGQSRELRADY